MSNTNKDIIISPNRGQAGLPEINFIGFDNAPIKLRVLDDNTLSWEGSQGQLFSINNNLTLGSIYSVNDVSGVPSIDVDANGVVSLAPYNGNVAVGHLVPTAKLHVKGNTANTVITRIENGTLDIADSLNQTTAQVSIVNSNNAFNNQLVNLNYTGTNSGVNYNAINIARQGTQTFRVRGDGLVTTKNAIVVDSTTGTLSVGTTAISDVILAQGTTGIKVNSTQPAADKFYFTGAINGVGDCFNIYRNGTTEYLNSRQDIQIRVNQLGGTGGKLSVSGGDLNVLTKLEANGDDQWLDTYGIFKANRNTVAENITIPTNTNTVSGGPITINSGNTVIISDGASWSIV
jgi:hypothetical protein